MTSAGAGSPAGSGPDRTPASGPALVSIGHYRIVGRLGEGGMGVVYEAEQESPRRRVALKVVRGGQFVDELQARLFQREIATLARLDHPNIGAIYESGRTHDGQPFFAMELVRGQTLDAWTARRPAAVTAAELRLRLELFRKLCDAVHYAHQRGVIHRDLKPQNIVVPAGETTRGSGSRPAAPELKILDFGLARITDAEVAAASLVTEVGAIKGTLAYMSPEQARGDPDGIDTRTDVYALGVMLHELVGGRRPYDLTGKSLVEALRVICEHPALPLARSSPDSARIDDDLRTLAGKAVEKDRERRYASAAALSEDIGRYLGQQPILARPPSALYQLRKLVARNRVPAALAALLLLLLIGFGIGMAALYGRSERNLERALSAELRSSTSFQLARDAVDRYFTQVSASPELKAHGLELLRQQLLGTARDFYEQLARQSEGSTDLRRDLGSTYIELGNISRITGAAPQAEQAYVDGIKLFEQLLVEQPGDRSATEQLAILYANLALVEADDASRSAQAESHYRRGLELEQQLQAQLAAGEPDPPEAIARRGNLLDNLALLLERMGRLDEARDTWLRAIAEREQAMASRKGESAYVKDLIATDNNLGSMFARSGRQDEAEPWMLKAVPLAEGLVRDHPEDADFLNAMAATFENLGGVQVLQGRLDEAAATYARSLPPRQDLVRRHPAVLEYRLFLGSSHTNLGELAVRAGRPAEGLPHFEQAIDTLQHVLADDPTSTTTRFDLSYTFAWRARAFDALHRYAEAVSDWESAIGLDDRGDASLREARDKSRSLAAGGGG